MNMGLSLWIFSLKYKPTCSLIQISVNPDPDHDLAKDPETRTEL